MIIRQATIDDLSAIVSIEAKCFPVAEAASENDLKARLLAFANHFYVLEDNNKIIGFINGMVSNIGVIKDEFYHDVTNHDENGKWQLIFGLDIIPEYRHLGLASRLLDYFIEAAYLEKRHGLVLTCKEELINFYSKHGFRDFGKSKSNHGGAIWYDMRFDFRKYNYVRTSRYLSFVLRHHPESIGLSVDKQGFVVVASLLKAMKDHGKYINQALLDYIVINDDKQRYHYNEDKTKIRAAQGHSINVDVGLIEKTPPKYLYHGTAQRFLDAIKVSGIKKMSRLYVHLSKDVTTAFKVGSRHGKPIVLVIDCQSMIEDGYRFYYSKNGLWLCDDIDFKYVSEIIDKSNG